MLGRTGGVYGIPALSRIRVASPPPLRLAHPLSSEEPKADHRAALRRVPRPFDEYRGPSTSTARPFDESLRSVVAPADLEMPGLASDHQFSPVNDKNPKNLAPRTPMTWVQTCKDFRRGQ